MAIITFVENIIYQNPNEQPTNIAGSPYGLNTITEDVDPYIKKYTVGPLNTPIDLGWLEDCAGMIFVHNCSENGTLFINDLGILIPPRATALASY